MSSFVNARKPGWFWGCLLFFAGAAAAYAKPNPVDQLVRPKQVQVNLKSSPVFAGRGDGLTTCPVTGEKIKNKKLKAEMYGRSIYFCCHGCLKAAKKQPDKFIKPTLAEQEQAVKAFLARASAANPEEFCNE